MKKILVIDDDKDILEAMCLVLSTEGYDTEIIAKCDETYQKVAEYKPDVIVLDVLLSGNDGRRICKTLKNDPETKHIPIVMMSAHPSAKDSVVECGADSFVPKPFSIDQLTFSIKTLVGT